MEKSLKTLLVILAVVALLFVATVITVSYAETEAPRFVYAAYEPGHGVHGIAEIPQGFRRCYVAGVFLNESGLQAVAIMPVNGFGEFSCENGMEAGLVALMLVYEDSGQLEVWDQWQLNYLDFVPPDLVSDIWNINEQGRGENT